MRFISVIKSVVRKVAECIQQYNFRQETVSYSPFTHELLNSLFERSILVQLPENFHSPPYTQVSFLWLSELETFNILPGNNSIQLLFLSARVIDLKVTCVNQCC